MPDTLPPRTAPTMADAIALISDEMRKYEGVAERYAGIPHPSEWEIVTLRSAERRIAHYRNALAAMRAVSGEPVDLGDLVREMRQCVESRPPLYAYGDNEAACAMAETIREMADRVTEVCEAVRVSPLYAFPTPTESTDAK